MKLCFETFIIKQQSSNIVFPIFSDHAELNIYDLSDTISKYMLEGPTSKLGIFANAAVATDAAPCAGIAR